MNSNGNDEDRNLILSSSVELEEYLSSTVILWQMKLSIPPLTPGNLLLAIRRMRLAGDDRLIKPLEKIDTAIQKRKSAWNKKIISELPLRLNQWQSTIDEIVEFGGVDHSYRYNVRVRVILTLLQDDLPNVDGKLLDRLSVLDAVLGRLVIPGDFIWQPELEAAFPREKFSFLYVRL